MAVDWQDTTLVRSSASPLEEWRNRAKEMGVRLSRDEMLFLEAVLELRSAGETVAGAVIQLEVAAGEVKDVALYHDIPQWKRVPAMDLVQIEGWYHLWGEGETAERR